MFLKTTALVLATATAAFAQSALVTVEASHGGAGSGLTNTSLTVPLNTVFTSTALDEVSTLYLTGAEDIDTDRITCTPYRYTNGTGTAGLAFTQDSPSYLSTNTVVVGSLVCTASALPGTSPSSTSITSSATSSITSTTSTSSSPTSSSSTTPTSTTSSTSTSSTSVSSSTSPSATSSLTSTTSSLSSSSTHTSSTAPRTSTSVFITIVTESSDSSGAGGAVTVTSTAPFVPTSVTTTTTIRQSSSTSVTPSLNTNAAALKYSTGGWVVAAGGVGLAALL